MDNLKELFKLNRNLVGNGFYKALKVINNILPLEIINIKSGTEFGTWTVPDEWILKDAWIKDPDGNKILEKNDFNVMVYSEPIHGFCQLPELKEHLFYSEENPDTIPYHFSFYEKNWGFCVKRNFIKEKLPNVCEGGDCTDELKTIDPTVGKVQIEGINYQPKFKDALKEGQYEVFIDTELKPGVMKLGVHTIPGKHLRQGDGKFGYPDREILLFAHLDHPFQANDNLSGVKCLLDIAEKLKEFNHTIKIIFCPETIGSIAYAETQDISKVDFVIAVDAVGNDNILLIQKAYNKYDRINYAVHLAVQELGISYRKADFRLIIGSDEYYFNDPLVGIPGIMLSRFPYKEYHTYADTPEILKEDMIKQVGEVILKTIEIYEKDYIPVRNFKEILNRSKFDIQTPYKTINRDLDYLFFDMDGKKWLSEISLPLGLTFTYCYDVLEKVGNLITKNVKYSFVNNSKGKIKKNSRKK